MQSFKSKIIGKRKLLWKLYAVLAQERRIGFIKEFFFSLKSNYIYSL